MSLLDDNGYEISNEDGWKFWLASGQIIVLFDTGSWKVEGSDPDSIESLLRLSEYQSGTE
jgi:hypothetical protein